MIKAKKQRKTVEREKLEISSGKLVIPREHSMQFTQSEYKICSLWYIANSKGKKEKELSEEALQIAEKREANGKGEKERYTL